MLELGSYHAIIACVAAGTGVALVPESVLDAMPQTPIRKHALPKALADMRTPLVWRDGEISPPVLALRTLVASFKKVAK
jgi:DNA-binding transcriptional LysR family regulator